jgi:hypothetical protein
LFGIAARSAKVLGATALALALGSVAGCADGGDELVVPAAQRPAASFEGDLVKVPAPVEIAAATTSNASNGKGNAPAPKVIYLVYADGKTSYPASNYSGCSGVAPKFNCTFGTSLLDCEQQIQAYLDQWFADFNVIFTLTQPDSGSYYTAVVSSGGGSWCNVKDSVAGVAPLYCQDIHTGTAFTLAAASARDTAVIIAHEQGHLLGLEHVTDANEIMFPSICQGCDGFENQSFSVASDSCSRPTQNSYQMVMQALGPWGGGPKPSAFQCINDSSPPTVHFLAPSDHEKTGHDFSVKVDAHDDCDLSSVSINVEPQGLSASSSKGPYEWDLTGVDGDQTITVTATDAAGHTTVATLDVVVPSAGQYVAQPTAPGSSGCTMASGAFGAAGLLPSLTVLLLFVGRARRPRARRRVVPGALSE